MELVAPVFAAGRGPLPGPVICFGEVLLRLSAPPGQVLLQSRQLDLGFGGAEANVAVSLARLGHDARMVTTLPDNGVGRAARDELRRHGVNVSGLSFAPGRMGLYFLTPGAGPRPAEVLYDRSDSAFARQAEPIDWDPALAGAAWLHVSGITAAIGRSTAAAAVEAVTCARRLGVRISLDANYRRSLWAAWDGDAPGLLSDLLAQADILFGDHRDVALILRQSPAPGDAPEALRQRAAERAFAAFPNLRAMAFTERVLHSATDNDLAGFLVTRDGAWGSEPRSLNPIVDRIGGGDAFAAGLLHGVLSGLGEPASLDFAVAAAALKHTMWGDFHLSTVADVENLLSEPRHDVRR